MRRAERGASGLPAGSAALRALCAQGAGILAAEASPASWRGGQAAHRAPEPFFMESESNVAPLRLYVSIKHSFRLSNIITSGDNRIFI